MIVCANMQKKKICPSSLHTFLYVTNKKHPNDLRKSSGIE